MSSHHQHPATKPAAPDSWIRIPSHLPPSNLLPWLRAKNKSLPCCNTFNKNTSLSGRLLPKFPKQHQPQPNIKNPKPASLTSSMVPYRSSAASSTKWDSSSSFNLNATPTAQPKSDLEAPCLSALPWLGLHRLLKPSPHYLTTLMRSSKNSWQYLAITKQTASTKLQVLRQGSPTASTFTSEFRQHACNNSWGDATLIHQFCFGLGGDVKDLLLMLPDPATLWNAITQAVRCNNLLYEQHQEQREGTPTTRKPLQLVWWPGPPLPQLPRKSNPSSLSSHNARPAKPPDNEASKQPCPATVGAMCLGNDIHPTIQGPSLVLTHALPSHCLCFSTVPTPASPAPQQPFSTQVPQPSSSIKTAPIYGLSPTEEDVLQAYVKQSLTNGFIQHSKSLAGALIIFVKKKDDSMLICVDYPWLKKITIRNFYSLH
ncbi:hypothetical protein SYNPS1DRAFT_30578 [Syncephalis pseudoplumigaleata]|uniref:Uncharacterized protein n=1 Tax=Syncephalis pseudoplumigaleata TaxID=1712513 RepID=A0A4P9YV53_9FUNG|nr:hypothetical protein SYNPS1DRAFT_30578 [Syncephalis pseudoplumigaleata]|eukprot:RKP23668.1 hypothetical protein SYNPS1DRAFT_30578 [Syncephalis pseudoplumigaleata]